MSVKPLLTCGRRTAHVLAFGIYNRRDVRLFFAELFAKRVVLSMVMAQRMKATTGVVAMCSAPIATFVWRLCGHPSENPE
jgi:hypothetical protein